MTDTNTEIIKLLKLPDKDFFKTRIKMLEQSINTLKQRKYKKSQQRNTRYKEESNTLEMKILMKEKFAG